MTLSTIRDCQMATPRNATIGLWSNCSVAFGNSATSKSKPSLATIHNPHQHSLSNRHRAASLRAETVTKVLIALCHTSQLSPVAAVVRRVVKVVVKVVVVVAPRAPRARREAKVVVKVVKVVLAVPRVVRVRGDPRRAYTRATRIIRRIVCWGMLAP